MARRDPENDPRAFLGAELARGHKAAGFSSQDALAARLGFDRTVIAKGETGNRPPTDEVLDAWCEACGLDRELFGRWAAFARRTDGPIPSWFEGWLEAERVARAALVVPDPDTGAAPDGRVREGSVRRGR